MNKIFWVLVVLTALLIALNVVSVFLAPVEAPSPPPAGTSLGNRGS